ncbi:MAG TPA: methyltransferase domain-containing protein [Gemmataceae bacterium]|nr:methyltransferase domain-containing protein [Gemmataceae bacterium]
MARSPAEWQLPPGVSRETWDYARSLEVARGYDAHLAGSPLLSAELDYARRHFAVPGRLIDLGCGTGRLLLDFAKSGFDVMGVDLSEEMLRIAATKATQASLRVQLLKANLVELDALADATFDYAACLFSTLGMIDGRVQRHRAIAQVYRLLQPGGKFLLHVHNRWFHFWDREGRKWLAGDLVRSVLRKRDGGDRSMPPHQGLAGLKLHHFTRREAKSLLTSAGFRVAAVEPLGLGPTARLCCSGWFGWLRACGYLLLAVK